MAPQVSDYKVTDVPIDARSLLKSAGQSHQLRFLALCVARLTGADEVEVAHLRVRDDGRIDGRDRAALGYFDWPVIEEEVRGIVAGVERAAQQRLFAVEVTESGQMGVPRLVLDDLDLRPGDHCSLCPAAQRCPAMRALAEDVVGIVRRGADRPEIVAASVDGADTADMAGAWALLRRAEAFTALLREELQRYAAIIPIPLGGGRELREVEVEREHIDARVAFGVMRDAYGSPRAWEILSTTKSAIKQVAGTAPGARSVLTEIRARGGASTTTTKQVREVAPQPPDRPAELRLTWDDMDPDDFAALHVGPRSDEKCT